MLRHPRIGKCDFVIYNWKDMFLIIPWKELPYSGTYTVLGRENLGNGMVEHCTGPKTSNWKYYIGAWHLLMEGQKSPLDTVR